MSRRLMHERLGGMDERLEGTEGRGGGISKEEDGDGELTELPGSRGRRDVADERLPSHRGGCCERGGREGEAELHPARDTGYLASSGWVGTDLHAVGPS